MKKLLLFIFVAISSLQIQAQLTNGDFTTEVDERLKNLNKTPITSNILIDRVFQVAQIPIFNQGTRIDTSSYVHFKQAWSELNRASYNQNFATITQFKEQLKNKNYQKNEVPIGIINTEFHQNNFGETSATATVSFNSVTGLFANIAGKNPFIKKQTSIIAPLKEKAIGSTIVFKTDLLFKLHKYGKTIKNLQLFTNNVTFSLISNYTLHTNNMTTTYTNTGIKNLRFVITYSDNSTKTTYGKLKVIVPTSYTQRANTSALETIPADSDLWYQGYDETQEYQGENEYRIYYDKINSDEIVNKPLYIIDGFDPEDTRKIDIEDYASDDPERFENIVALMKYDHDNNSNTDKVSLIDSLRHKGFDVIIVNHPQYKRGTKEIDGGSDYIQRNAFTFISLIRKIKSQQQGNEKAVIIGPSMGGLISRYALAYMEKKLTETGDSTRWYHNTRLWVSFDSPHQGANVPIGVQKGIQYFNEKLEVESAKEFIKVQLDRPATKEMLVNHYTNNTSLPVGATNFRNRFQTELDNLGMPQNLRKVALLNGSVMGTLNGVSKAKYLEIEDELTHVSALFVPIFIIGWIHTFLANTFADKFLAKMYHSTNQKTGNQKHFILDAGIRGKFLWWSWWTTRTSGNQYKSQPISKGSYDVSPGGYYNAQQLLANSSDTPKTSLEYLAIVFHALNATVFDPTHAFIPTKSALAYTGSNVLDEVIGTKDRVCTGETPFNSYFAPQNNQEHIFLTSENVAWLTEEILGHPQPVKTYIPSNTNILGDVTICNNKTNTYSINVPSSCIGAINWNVSPNLQIVSQNYNTITVVPISTTTNETGYIEVSLPNANLLKSKTVWVGLPPDTNEMSILKVGSYNFYAQQWTKLKVQSLITLIDEVPYEFTYQWQVPNSQIRTFNDTRFIDVKPNYSGQLNVGVKAINECGCSNWKYQLFDVLPNSTGGGGGGMIPIRNY